MRAFTIIQSPLIFISNTDIASITLFSNVIKLCTIAWINSCVNEYSFYSLDCCGEKIIMTGVANKGVTIRAHTRHCFSFYWIRSSLKLYFFVSAEWFDAIWLLVSKNTVELRIKAYSWSQLRWAAFNDNERHGYASQSALYESFLLCINPIPTVFVRVIYKWYTRQ